MDALKAIWNELALRYTDSAELVAELWTEIDREYSSSERHYHNLTHLVYMTNLAVRYKDNLTDPDTVLFSIFYHDIVYDSKSQDNEQKSADIACDRLIKLGVPADKIADCRHHIIATKDHKDSENNDTNYLVDFDLAILGDTPENYKTYREKIRLEYSIYPDLLYNKGRKKVLQHFLRMDKIFKTVPFHENYEQMARENLRTEFRTLP